MVFYVYGIIWALLEPCEVIIIILKFQRGLWDQVRWILALSCNHQTICASSCAVYILHWQFMSPLKKTSEDINLVQSTPPPPRDLLRIWTHSLGITWGLASMGRRGEVMHGSSASLYCKGFSFFSSSFLTPSSLICNFLLLPLFLSPCTRQLTPPFWLLWLLFSI